MAQTPQRLTVIPSFNGQGFTVLTQDWSGEISVAEGLSYDEMLGNIARTLCPTMDDGSPQRFLGRPLFLTNPKTTGTKNQI